MKLKVTSCHNTVYNAHDYCFDNNYTYTDDIQALAHIYRYIFSICTKVFLKWIEITVLACPSACQLIVPLSRTVSTGNFMMLMS